MYSLEFCEIFLHQYKYFQVGQNIVEITAITMRSVRSVLSSPFFFGKKNVISYASFCLSRYEQRSRIRFLYVYITIPTCLIGQKPNKDGEMVL